MKILIGIILIVCATYAQTFEEAVKRFNNKEYVEAYEIFSDLALNNDSNAQYNLALMNYKGIGVNQNKQLAFFWYDKAAENNNLQAINNLAQMYMLGEGGVKKDKAKARELYTKAAEAGYSIAQLNLAFLLEESLDKEDLKESFFWYEKAALQGVIAAQNNLGKMYGLGIGVKADKQKSLYWFTQAANSNDPIAQANLAVMYLKGDIVNVDIDLAVKLFKKAGENGNLASMLQLGEMYGNGNVISQDYKEALYWYEKALKMHNNTTALFHVGLYYFNGYGVAKDEEKGLKYLEEAKSKGYKRAENFFKINNK